MAGRRLRVPRDRSIESELKFRVRSTRDHTKLRNLLRKRGAKLIGRYKEDNYRFNGPGKSTRNTTLRLRVLNGGPRGVLTAKGPAYALKDSYSVMARKHEKAKKPTKSPAIPVVIPPAAA